VRELWEPPPPLDRFFHDWRGGECGSEAYGAAVWAPFREAVSGCVAVSGAREHGYWRDDAPCSMPIDEVEAIWSAIDTADDWTPLYSKVTAIRRMGAALG
jgi:hypothetical protein